MFITFTPTTNFDVSSNNPYAFNPEVSLFDFLQLCAAGLNCCITGEAYRDQFKETHAKLCDMHYASKLTYDEFSAYISLFNRLQLTYFWWVGRNV